MHANITFTKISEPFSIIVCNTHWTFFSRIAKYSSSKDSLKSLLRTLLPIKWQCYNQQQIFESIFHSLIWIKLDIGTGRRHLRWSCKVGLDKPLHPLTSNLPAAASIPPHRSCGKDRSSKEVDTLFPCNLLKPVHEKSSLSVKTKERKEERKALLFCCLKIKTSKC